MQSDNFEFGVAFSFHSVDEALATQLNDRVQDRFKTFLYSKKQEMLAGADGEEVFNSVFGRKARLVVVLCRKEWGETPFTRIEQTAIRNRAFDKGFDFSLFVPTDKPPFVPQAPENPEILLRANCTGSFGIYAKGEPRREFSPTDLAEHLLRLYIDAADAHRKAKR